MVAQILEEEDVRRIVRDEAAPPTFVHQRIVERITGIPGKQYMRDARNKAFASTKERRLVLARTLDVIAYYEQRIALREHRPSNDHDAEAIAFERVGARRVAR